MPAPYSFALAVDCASLPRPRGGGPSLLIRSAHHNGSSPPTRGWTPYDALDNARSTSLSSEAMYAAWKPALPRRLRLDNAAAFAAVVSEEIATYMGLPKVAEEASKPLPKISASDDGALSEDEFVSQDWFMSMQRKDTDIPTDLVTAGDSTP